MITIALKVRCFVLYGAISGVRIMLRSGVRIMLFALDRVLLLKLLFSADYCDNSLVLEDQINIFINEGAQIADYARFLRTRFTIVMGCVIQ